MSVIDHLLHQFGYPAVGGVVGAESVGLPLPGETILILAGVYAGTTHHLSPTVVVVVAVVVAAILGDNLGYWIGVRFGTRVLARIDQRGGRWSRHLHRAQESFDRHGSLIVVLGRFVSVVRTYVAFLSGATRMRWRRFAALNSVSCMAWAILIGGGAAALGSNAGHLGGRTLTVVLVVAAVVVVSLQLRVRWSHRTERREQNVRLQ